MLTVTYVERHIKALHAKCRYAECRGAIIFNFIFLTICVILFLMYC
jgi:hypothetical protein